VSTHLALPEVDLRSDTVTRPTAAMRAAMHAAAVGDDVFGEDPGVNALEARIAAELDMAAALFVPSGTMSNLLALLTHCQRGDEYIAGGEAHTYKFEAGGGAVLGGIQPQPVPFAADGSLPLDAVAAVIKPDDFHFARTRLVCLENTQNGLPLSLAYLDAWSAFCVERGLARHLDGARLFNAAVALDVPAREIARWFDTVSVCFSKGLGAPVGSALCGPAPFIERARRWRKMVGGGMRQAGSLAAAASHALDHHVARLADDHRRAQQLADALQAIPACAGKVRCATNMVYLDLDAATLAAIAGHHRARGIRVAERARLVLHLDVDDAGLARVIDAYRAFFAAGGATDQ
jgi:threonine aldolase